jgi:hypothetical protein
MSLSQTDFPRDWLAQFSGAERPVAAQLADAVMLVSHDALYRGLRLLLDETITNRDEGNQDRPIALFAERAVETRNTKDGDYGFVRREILPFFPGTNEGRATGAGMPPIVTDPSDQEVGSEGAIANFITGYERLHRDRVLSHPGPDALRTGRVSHIVIVADFIGSGKRVWEMLEAFWRVATIRSWHSYGFVRFAVVAYSGTEDGLKHVRSHRSGPNVRVVHACPTIFTAFVGADRDAVGHCAAPIRTKAAIRSASAGSARSSPSRMACPTMRRRSYTAIEKDGCRSFATAARSAPTCIFRRQMPMPSPISLGRFCKSGRQSDFSQIQPVAAGSKRCWF